MNTTFDAINERRSVRKFSQREVSEDLLFELLNLANRAPSGFNLQPWHFIVVRDESLKELLCHIAMDQQQILDAPFTIVFLANSMAWKEGYNKVLRLSEESGTLSKSAVNYYRKQVNLVFRTGPLGIFGLLKRIAIPFMRLRKPTPNVITSHLDAVHYAQMQTMLAASSFMIAAKSAGLDSSPMEGFDEERLKKLLAIPKTFSVPMLIAVGYALESAEDLQSVRIDVEEKVSVDLFPNKLSRTA